MVTRRTELQELLSVGQVVIMLAGQLALATTNAALDTDGYQTVNLK